MHFLFSPSLCVVTSSFRGAKARKEYQQRLKFYKDHLAAIVKIQAKWKAKHVEKAYKAICNIKTIELVFQSANTFCSLTSY